MGICVLKDLADPTFDPHIADDVAFGAIDDPWPLIARCTRVMLRCGESSSAKA